MNSQFRERVLTPIAVILGAFVAVEILAISLSRVLLASGHEQAVFVALGAALAILLGCAFIAARPRISSSTLKALAVLAFLTVVGAGVASWQKAEDAGHGAAHEGAPVESRPGTQAPSGGGDGGGSGH